MRRTLPALAAATTGLALLAGCQLPDSVPTPEDLGTDRTAAPAPTATGDTAALLDRFDPQPEHHGGYDRDDWPHWEQVQAPRLPDNCDAREAILLQEGQDVDVDGACEDTSGSWSGYYGGPDVTDSSDTEIDHVVPLVEAHRSGGWRWTEEEREAFANDLDQLVITTGDNNGEKSGNDPAGWMPPPDQRCSYARLWLKTKANYALTIDQDEYAALEDALTTCNS